MILDVQGYWEPLLPQGFNLLDLGVDTKISVANRNLLAWKIATTADLGVQINIPQRGGSGYLDEAGYSREFAATLISYSGVDKGRPVVSLLRVGSSAGVNTIAQPAYTTTVANETILWIVAASQTTGKGVTWTLPAGVTQRANLVSTHNATLAVTDKLYSTVGTTAETVSFTLGTPVTGIVVPSTSGIGTIIYYVLSIRTDIGGGISTYFPVRESRTYDGVGGAAVVIPAPTDLAVGDQMFVNATDVGLGTTPTGWTLEATAATGRHTSALFRKTAVSGDLSSTFSFTPVASSIQNVTYVYTAVGGVSSSTPLNNIKTDWADSTASVSTTLSPINYGRPKVGFIRFASFSADGSSSETWNDSLAISGSQRNGYAKDGSSSFGYKSGISALEVSSVGIPSATVSMDRGSWVTNPESTPSFSSGSISVFTVSLNLTVDGAVSVPTSVTGATCIGHSNVIPENGAVIGATAIGHASISFSPQAGEIYTNPVVVTSSSGTSTVNITGGPSGPTTNDATGNNITPPSLWYKVVVPEASTVTFDTVSSSSSLNTVIEVWQGDDPATATLLTSNNDVVTSYTISPINTLDYQQRPVFGTPNSFWNYKVPSTATLATTSANYVSRLATQFSWDRVSSPISISNDGQSKSSASIADSLNIPFYMVPVDQPRKKVWILQTKGADSYSAGGDTRPLQQIWDTPGGGQPTGVPVPDSTNIPGGFVQAHDAVVMQWYESVPGQGYYDNCRLWEMVGLRKLDYSNLPTAGSAGAIPTGYDYVCDGGGYVENVQAHKGFYQGSAHWGISASGGIGPSGRLTVEDQQSEDINHAIGLAVYATDSSRVDPATNNDTYNGTHASSGTVDPYRLPEGTRFRLPITFDIEAFLAAPFTLHYTDNSGTAGALVQKTQTFPSALAAAASLSDPVSAGNFRKILKCMRDYGIVINDSRGIFGFAVEGNQSLNTPYNFNTGSSTWGNFGQVLPYSSFVQIQPEAADAHISDTPTVDTRSLMSFLASPGSNYYVRVYDSNQTLLSGIVVHYSITPRTVDSTFPIVTVGTAPATPGPVPLSFTNVAADSQVAISIDGTQVQVLTADSTGSLVNQSVILPSLAVGTHTASIVSTTGVSSTVFEVLSQGSSAMPTPGSNVGPTPVTQTGVVKWILQDPVPGGVGNYVFPINPADFGSPIYTKNFSTDVSTAPDGAVITYEGARRAGTWEFSGYLETQAFYNALLKFSQLRRRVYVIDHFNRAWTVVVDSFDPKVVRNTAQPWAFTYTVHCTLFEGPVQL